MRFVLNGLVRATALLALASGAVAVTRARLAPTPAHFRLAAPPAFGVINGFLLQGGGCGPRFVDAETGALRAFRVPDGDRFEYGACSPWRDDQGECQVVGRWMRHRCAGSNGYVYGACGLARYALPSGRVLSQVALDAVPTSHPCWFPDMSERVLYAAGDGRLYRVDFGAADQDGEEPESRPVAWRCRPPAKKVMIRDPVWPTDPRFGGRLVVSLQLREGNGPEVVPGRLWWLALSPDGGSIVAAGPLTDPGLGAVGPSRWEERYPNLAKAPDGRLALAYLAREGGAVCWQLRLAPVTTDDRGGPPAVATGAARAVTGGHLPSLPAFSADGRWVFGILTSGPAGQVVRFPTEAGASPGPDAAALHAD
jgi:hypothetical protein